MKNSAELIAPVRATSNLFNNWNGLIRFLERFVCKPEDGNVIRISGTESGKWQVAIEENNSPDRPVEKIKVNGIGLHDLVW